MGTPGMSWNFGDLAGSGSGDPSPMRAGLLRDWPFALSCDDAPTVSSEGRAVTEDPERLDSIRTELIAQRVRHCTAFVVGHNAEGQEARLRRWLDAGYQLGNHTFSHLRASRVSGDEFIADVKRCDELLAAVGAFARGQPRLFRFPSLDRGYDQRHREALAARVRDLGYTIAHASVDFFDYLFEEPLGAAERGNEAALLESILERYAEVAASACAHEARRVHRGLGRTVPLIAFFHCGPTSALGLRRVLTRLRGVRWCTQTEALADDLYVRFDRQYETNGRVARSLLQRTLRERVTGKLAALSAWPGLFAQRRLGPLWPFLA